MMTWLAAGKSAPCTPSIFCFTFSICSAAHKYPELALNRIPQSTGIPSTLVARKLLNSTNSLPCQKSRVPTRTCCPAQSWRWPSLEPWLPSFQSAWNGQPLLKTDQYHQNVLFYLCHWHAPRTDRPMLFFLHCFAAGMLCDHDRGGAFLVSHVFSMSS